MPKLLLLLALSLAAFGEDRPYLVRDLPGVSVNDSMSYGRVFWTTIGNTTWFVASTSDTSVEIFRTDGTPDGTVQATHGHGLPGDWAFLGMADAKLVYGGRDAGGEGVFALDTGGGVPVLLSRLALPYLTNGVARGDSLYFAAKKASSGEHELWRTDGTPDGTVKVDLMPGDAGAFDPARDTSLFALDQWIFFYGATPQGMGLHRTDGTPANTSLLLPLSTTALGATAPCRAPRRRGGSRTSRRSRTLRRAHARRRGRPRAAWSRSSSRTSIRDIEPDSRPSTAKRAPTERCCSWPRNSTPGVSRGSRTGPRPGRTCWRIVRPRMR